MQEEIQKILTRLMSECLGSEFRLTNDDTIESLGGDQLDAHMFLCELEDRFCVTAPFDESELFCMSATEIERVLQNVDGRTNCDAQTTTARRFFG